MYTRVQKKFNYFLTNRKFHVIFMKDSLNIFAYCINRILLKREDLGQFERFYPPC